MFIRTVFPAIGWSWSTSLLNFGLPNTVNGSLRLNTHGNANATLEAAGAFPHEAWAPGGRPTGDLE
jgi:hypothetical protein